MCWRLSFLVGVTVGQQPLQEAEPSKRSLGHQRCHLRGDSRALVALVSLFCLLAWEVSSVHHTLLSSCAVLARGLKENMGLSILNWIPQSHEPKQSHSVMFTAGISW